MHTRFEDRPPMRAALAYYLTHDPQSSGRGIMEGQPNAIKWPSGTGGGYMELDQGPMTGGDFEIREWIAELCTHNERLGLYRVMWIEPDQWSVIELNGWDPVGESIELDIVDEWSSSGLKP